MALTGCHSSKPSPDNPDAAAAADSAADGASAQSQLSLNVAKLAIPSPANTSNNGFVVISNPTAAGVDLGAISLTGSNAADFAVVDTQGNALAEPCPSTLAAGSSCRVIVSFTPSQALGAAETATLTVGAALSPATLAVEGDVTAGQDITQISGCTLMDASGCLAALHAALGSAASFYAGCMDPDPAPNSGGNYTVVIPAGTFDLSTQDDIGNEGHIVLNDIYACNGRFVLSGAGAALTSLYNNNSSKTISGRNVSNVTIQGISFRRADQTSLNALSITQGTYVSDKVVNQQDVVTIDISPGFPSPEDIMKTYQADDTTVNYIKAYDNTNPADPVIDTDQLNDQLAFGGTIPTCTLGGSGTRCTVTLNKTTITPSLYQKPNHIVCFKMESSQAYLLQGPSDTNQGDSVGFTDVFWYDSARGAFRQINHPFVTYSAIKRRAPTPDMNGQAGCVASWAGGPQFGQPSDAPIHGILLDHFVSEGTADEATEIFNEDSSEPAGGSVVSNVTMHSSFGGDIVLSHSCAVTFDWTAGPRGTPLNQTLTNCDLYQGDGTGQPRMLSQPQVNGMPTYGGCVAYYQGSPTCNDTGILENANQ